MGQHRSIDGGVGGGGGGGSDGGGGDGRPSGKAFPKSLGGRKVDGWITLFYKAKPVGIVDVYLRRERFPSKRTLEFREVN